LQGTDTPAYWVHLLVTKKVNYCESGSITNVIFSCKLLAGEKHEVLGWKGLTENLDK